MIIIISALSAVGYGGVTYFTNLLPAVSRLGRHRFHVFANSEGPLKNLSSLPGVTVHRVNVPGAFARFLWEQCILPLETLKLSGDVIFNAKNICVFFSPCANVIAVRNMEPFFPGYSKSLINALVTRLRSWLTDLSLFRADTIVAVSNFAGSCLLKKHPSLKNKVRVIYNGNPLLPRVFAQEKNFILSASKYTGYANQLRLIQGYAIAASKQDMPPLLLAGGIHDHTYYRQVVEAVRSRGLETKIRILGMVDSQRLTKLYASCRVFVFPSMLEACPQTLIEAMASGCAIAASAFEPMPEICADAALYFHPEKPKEIAHALEQLLFDHTLHSSLKEKAMSRARAFSWDRSAGQLCGVFEETRRRN